jgi:hypothetical protein
MTLSPRLPSGLACDTAGSGPADAELSRMTELALSWGAQSVAIGRGRSAAAAEAAAAFARRWEASGATVLTVVTWPTAAATSPPSKNPNSTPKNSAPSTAPTATRQAGSPIADLRAPLACGVSVVRIRVGRVRSR